MNRNFKVVFSKARGALMVVNEATSSVQAKGTKTVIAAAVAALSLGAGVASAAGVQYDSAEIGSGASLTVNADGNTPSGVVGTKTDSTTGVSTTGTMTKEDTVASTGAYTLSGGELIINGTTFDGKVAEDTDAKKANGTITLNSVAKSGTVNGASYTAIAGTFSKLDLNLNVYNAASNGTKGDVTIGADSNDLTIKEGTLKTGTIEGSSTAADKKAGIATITGKNLAFGVAPDPVGDKGETSVTNPGFAYDFDNAADVTLNVTAKETVQFNKGTITNAGTMTVTGESGVFVGNQDLTVGKQVTIANTGDLIFTDTTKVDFNADYTATAGHLVIKSAANTIYGNITADSLKFGAANTDLAKETNQVVITGTTSNTIAYGSTVDVKALTVADKATTVKGALKAAATTIGANQTGGLTVEDASNEKLAVVTLGDITVGSTKETEKDAGSFTLKNTAKNAVEASSLTVVKNTNASTFELDAGKFSVGKLTNQGNVTLKAGEFSLTGEGSNASDATITLADTATASLVIAEGASLQNQGDITGTDNTKGKIKVSGTLTNLPKIEAVGGNKAVDAGTITAAAVEVDGVLSTALDTATYDVAETTINTAGELQTSLNARLDGAAVADQKPANALEIANTIDLAGKITAAGAEVQDYIVNINATDGAFTLKADKTFNTVQVKAGAFATDDADVTLSVLEVKETGTATVDSGTLNVTTLKTAATTNTVTVEDGTLATSLTGLGLKYTDSGFAPADATTAGAGKVANKSIVLKTSSLLDLDLGSVTEVTSAQLSGLTGLVSDDTKGLIDIGATKIKDVEAKIEGGKIAYTELSSIAGVTNDTIKSVTVTKVGESISGKDAIYGTIEQEDEAVASKDFTISDLSLTLTGTGNLVSYTNTTDGKKVPTLSTIKFTTADSELVTTGEGAQIGQVGDSDQNGSLYVKSGDLTANGSVTINSLEVESGAKLSIADDKDGNGYAVTTGDASNEATALISGELAAANSDVTFGSTAMASYDADGAVSSFGYVNKVTGKLAAKTLTLKGDTLVAQGGTVEAGKLDATGKTVFVGDSASAGSLSVGELTAGSIYADPTWKEDGSAAAVSLVAVKKAAATGASVEADRSSIVSVGTNDVTAGTAAFAKTGFTLAKTDAAKKEYSINTKTVNSVVYAEGAQYAGAVLADGNGTKDTVNGVTIGTNSMLLIDATKVDATGEKSVFVQGVNMADNSVLYVDNVKNGDKISLSAAASKIGGKLVHEGDLLMGANEADREKGVLSFEMEDQADLAKSGITGAGFGVIYAMYENGENVGNDNAVFFRNLVSTQTSAAYQQFSNGKYEWNTQTLNTILNDVAAIGATTGAQAVTMDAVNQMADTVAARTSILTQRAQGVNVWVDVNGGRFEGKKVMDGAGYSSDIYAGTLGADYQFANGAVLGAALTIGTADTDSKGTTAKTSMDSDLVGFSVYGSKTFADIWNVAGDIGYLQASNDVTESGYGFGDFSEDVNAFTLGVRGEVLTKAGSVNIVPHLGLRYTRLSTDGFTAGFNTEIDDQNIFQMPVGVTVSADFETSGWTIAPKFDLSVVPTFGDKDADLKLGITGVSASDDLSVRVIDSNPVQATLGVSATNGAWGFGLNYKLGVGSDDRMNNSFNASVRYAF
ncbi:autotransporter domain-containing protein [Sutterella wadsworthensis]|uniref:autotransporter domain-containing protein n=3 Tax=Sutterella wadsworthensis TaxID=40545 RepID=UPI0026709BB6|nr:autotransporter domain-containing protein [Sutterella wadsworthensis]